MPNFDGKGPTGLGPMTGRKRGRCAGSQKQQNEATGNKPDKEERTGFGLGRGGRAYGGGRKRLRLHRGSGKDNKE